MRRAALLAAALGACTHTPHPDPEKLNHAVGVEGRVLTQTIEVEDDGIVVCAHLKSSRSTFVTSGLASQLYRFAETTQGQLAGLTDWTIMPSPSPTPPPSTYELGYTLLDADVSLTACSLYRYEHFSTDQVYITTEFRPWLKRNAPLPAAIEGALASKWFARPLYSDETLRSNTCFVDRVAKQAEC